MGPKQQANTMFAGEQTSCMGEYFIPLTEEISNTFKIGIMKYIEDKGPSISPVWWQKLVDPDTRALDHWDMSGGVGLILCPGTTCRLRIGRPVHLKGLGLLLEPTIFGTAISGSVPEVLRSKVDALCTFSTFSKVVARKQGRILRLRKRRTTSVTE